MHITWRVLQLLALPTAGLAVAFVLAPDRGELETQIWLLVVLVLSLGSLLAVVHAGFPSAPSPFVASLRRPVVSGQRPASLARIERGVAMAEASAFDVHYRLRPVLVELAEELLAARRGIELRRDPGRSHAVLGDDVWEIVRPDRPEPRERLADGISAVDLARVVSSLERI